MRCPSWKSSGIYFVAIVKRCVIFFSMVISRQVVLYSALRLERPITYISLLPLGCIALQFAAHDLECAIDFPLQ